MAGRRGRPEGSTGSKHTFTIIGGIDADALERIAATDACNISLPTLMDIFVVVMNDSDERKSQQMGTRGNLYHRSYTRHHCACCSRVLQALNYFLHGYSWISPYSKIGSIGSSGFAGLFLPMPAFSRANSLSTTSIIIAMVKCLSPGQ